ncbi:hypothetical protein [Nocardiopsis oceani]
MFQDLIRELLGHPVDQLGALIHGVRDLDEQVAPEVPRDRATVLGAGRGFLFALPLGVLPELVVEDLLVERTSETRHPLDPGSVG